MKSLKLAIIGDFSWEIAIYRGFLKNCREIARFYRGFLENRDFIVKSVAISRTWVIICASEKVLTWHEIWPFLLDKRFGLPRLRTTSRFSRRLKIQRNTQHKYCQRQTLLHLTISSPWPEWAEIWITFDRLLWKKDALIKGKVSFFRCESTSLSYSHSLVVEVKW